MNKPKVYKMGQKVKIYSVEGKPIHKGKIVGTATVQEMDKELRLLYVVSLDRGFWNEAKDVYLTIILVHPESFVYNKP